MGLFSRNKNKNNGELGKFEFNYVSGLDFPPDSYCLVTLYNDKLILKFGNKEYTLLVEKIKSVNYGFNLEKDKYIQSSITKGLIGAATLGVAGAVIGASPKTVEKSKTKSYDVIQYLTKEGKTNQIVVEDFRENSQDSSKFARVLQSLLGESNNESIEL